MHSDSELLEKEISGETGIPFAVEIGMDSEGQPWYLLRPRGQPANHAFGIRVLIGWRHLRVSFEPDKFSGDLLLSMGKAHTTGRTAFRSILRHCTKNGAGIRLIINEASSSFDDDAIWSREWKRVQFTLTKSQIAPGPDERKLDMDAVLSWTRRFVSAVVSILPIEHADFASEEESLLGYPEGAVETLQVNRYERDRRNRLAAIAIHGVRCLACGLDFGKHYGEIAAGFIEIHHTTPVSQMGDGYVVNPETDLVPLCPNCHSVAHRQDPPLSVDKIKDSLTKRNLNK